MVMGDILEANLSTNTKRKGTRKMYKTLISWEVEKGFTLDRLRKAIRSFEGHDHSKCDLVLDGEVAMLLIEMSFVKPWDDPATWSELADEEPI